MADGSPTTLYRLFSATGDLLYVGIAGNPGRRFEQHRKDKFWWGEVAGITLEHFPNRIACAQAELVAISDEDPKYNIQGRGSRHLAVAPPPRPTPVLGWDAEGLRALWGEIIAPLPNPPVIFARLPQGGGAGVAARVPFWCPQCERVHLQPWDRLVSLCDEDQPTYFTGYRLRVPTWQGGVTGLVVYGLLGAQVGSWPLTPPHGWGDWFHFQREDAA